MPRESPRAAEHLRRSRSPEWGGGWVGTSPGPTSVPPVLPQPSVDSAGSVGTPQINIHANGREGADGRTGENSQPLARD